MNDTDENFLWAMIDLAWKKAEKEMGERPSVDPGPLRKAVLEGHVEDYEEAMRPFCVAFEDVLTRIVTGDGLVTLIEAFETMLYRLDREDLAARIGLGDDGFLDARAFIVAMGRDYYTSVLRAPSAARPRASAERVYIAVRRAYEQRYKEPYRRRGPAVSTGSNLEGWPRARARAAAESRLGQATDEAWVSLGLSESRAPLASLVLLRFLPREELEDVILRLAARIRERRARAGG